jgi:predicted Fe-Mo cluster-binding NifX family protein
VSTNTTSTRLELSTENIFMNDCIAVASQDNNGLSSIVSEHFGRCAFFALAAIQDNQILSIRVVDNPYAQQHAPGQVPAFIGEQGASVLLTGGIGVRAAAVFDRVGIQVATGAAGTVQEAIQAYLAGRLQGASPCAESRRHRGVA